jgi:hypothetical protein
VITALFHTAVTKMLELVQHQMWKWLCAQAASVITSMLCGSRLWELSFLLYQFELENVAVSFVLYFVVCNKSELVKNSQLRIVDWGQYLSVRLVNNIESCEIKNWEAKHIFHYTFFIKLQPLFYSDPRSGCRNQFKYLQKFRLVDCNFVSWDSLSAITHGDNDLKDLVSPLENFLRHLRKG